jgi:hypothetical protein
MHSILAAMVPSLHRSPNRLLKKTQFEEVQMVQTVQSVQAVRASPLKSF